jgi:hypothetical protein
MDADDNYANVMACAPALLMIWAVSARYYAENGAPNDVLCMKSELSLGADVFLTRSV